jgi:hypothetical protein
MTSILDDILSGIVWRLFVVACFTGAMWAVFLR